jgi:hypothetical protein
MATLVDCTTKYSVLFCVKGLSAKAIHKKDFIFIVGNVCRVKQFSLGGKHFVDDEEIETEVRKWLKQQLKDVHAAGFDAPVKRWDKCIIVGGGFVET